MQTAEKPPLTRAITGFAFNAHVICGEEEEEEEEEVFFDGGSILHLILWEKNNRWHDTGLKYVSYVISIFRSTNLVFNGYP